MRKAIRYILIVLALLLLIAAVGVYFLYHASQHVPEFYTQELKVAPQTQEKESDHLLEQATTLETDIQRRGRWEQVFEAKTINAWLAVDLPRNHPNLLAPGMRDPRVRIGPEGITAACQIDRGHFHGVIWLQLSAFVESADVVGLRIHKARLGSIPWSLEPILTGISEAARHNKVRIVWRQIEGDPVALITLTPPESGRKRIIHIDTIDLKEGELILAGTTEAVKN